MKVLFVCTANRIRSRGAEAWCEKKFPLHEFNSCGTSKQWVENTQAVFPGAQVITQELVNWADKIVFFEQIHAADTRKKLGPNCLENKPIEVWNLPDIFDSWDDKKFTDTLELMEFDDFFD